MIIKNHNQAPTYFTDREKKIINSDRKVYTKKRINKILKHCRYFNEDFYVVKHNRNFGISLEYETAWLNENNIDGVNSSKMEDLEIQYLEKIKKLNVKNVEFFLSRHSGNINNALTIHAFIKEEDLFNWTPSYLNTLYELIVLSKN